MTRFVRFCNLPSLYNLQNREWVKSVIFTLTGKRFACWKTIPSSKVEFAVGICWEIGQRWGDTKFFQLLFVSFGQVKHTLQKHRNLTTFVNFNILCKNHFHSKNTFYKIAHFLNFCKLHKTSENPFYKIKQNYFYCKLHKSFEDSVNIICYFINFCKIGNQAGNSVYFCCQI